MKYPSPADIAEMKARGYDSTTIAEAELQSERWAASQEVCRTIEAAFAGVTLGGGVGLQEAQGLDDYGDAATCAAYRKRHAERRYRKKWRCQRLMAYDIYEK